MNSAAEPANTIITKVLMMDGCASILTASIAQIGRNTMIPAPIGKDGDLMANVSNDVVNHPSHYTQGSIECIDAMKSAFGAAQLAAYCKIAAFKYIWRCERKNGTEDVKKAIWYLNKFLELEGEPNDTV